MEWKNVKTSVNNEHYFGGILPQYTLSMRWRKYIYVGSTTKLNTVVY